MILTILMMMNAVVMIQTMFGEILRHMINMADLGLKM